MKSKKTNLLSRIGNAIFFPVLVLFILLLSPKLFSNINILENDVKGVTQDTTLQTPISILGKVVDLDHNPLEGVMVNDINSDVDEMTDELGKFELTIDKPILITFSKIGFYNLDHNVVKSDSNLVVILTPESNELIVQGFDSMTNQVDKNPKMLESIKSLDTMNTKPMYIVDDVNMKADFDLNSINPSDIKSVEVLKDSHTSQYGIDGKNGVVKIYTKSYKNMLDNGSANIHHLDSTSTLKKKYENRMDSINMMKMDKSKDNKMMNMDKSMDSTMMKRDKSMDSTTWNNSKKMMKNNSELIIKNENDLK